MLIGDPRSLPRTIVSSSAIPAVAVALLGIVATGCSGTAATRPPRRATTTLAAPTTTSTAAPPTTPSTDPASFPLVIVQAMAQFNPMPAGARAPIRLPAVSGYVTAQTGGLGGKNNVTLIVTSAPVPVNSPSLSSAGAGRELASFATTPTASQSNAAGELAQARSQSIATCGGPSSATSLSNGAAATTCPTLEGAAVNWTVGNWTVQVLSLDGTSPQMTEADHIAGLLSPTTLPQSDAGGIVSIVVPGNPSAGSSTTAAFEWTVGTDVYEVRSTDDPDSAVAVAAAMRPYPS